MAFDPTVIALRAVLAAIPRESGAATSLPLLTSAHVAALSAHNEVRAAFATAFPAGCDFGDAQTPARFAAAGLRVEWFADRLLTEAGRAAYLRGGRVPALACVSAALVANGTFKDAQADALRALRTTSPSSCRAYEKACAAALEVHNEATARAHLAFRTALVVSLGDAAREHGLVLPVLAPESRDQPREVYTEKWGR